MLHAVFPEGVDEIEVSGITQWDRGQMLKITYSGLPTIYQVHFTYKGAKVALMVPALDTNTVEIPDELLQQPRDLVAYVYLIGEDGSGETVKTVNLPLVRRAKPEDYTSDLTPTQMEFIESMLASMNSKAENAVSVASQAKTDAAAAASSARASAEAAVEAVDAAEEAEEAVTGLTVAAETLDPTAGVEVQRSTNASGGIHLLFKVPRGEPGDKGDKGEPGRGLSILGYYESLDALTAAVTAPAVGDGYGVGTEAPYDIYIYDGVGAGWVNNGPLQGPEGEKGDPGVSTEHSWNGTTLTITSASGTSSADLKGEKGDTGAGAQHSWNGTVLTVTSVSGTSSADLKGEKGDTGAGFRVLGYYASVSALTAAVTGPEVGDAYGVGTAAPYDIYIWDGSAWVNNGQLQGAKGDKGDPGVSTTHAWNGTVLTITSASGTSSTDLKGEKGDKGDTYTLTDTDKSDIADLVLAALPAAEGVSV